jgi:hypothetical protein
VANIRRPRRFSIYDEKKKNKNRILFTFLFVCVNPNEKEMTKCIFCVCVYEYSVCCGSLTFQRERENNIQGGPNSVLFGPRPKGKEHNIEP